MGSQIIKTEKLGSFERNPFAELQRITVQNTGETVELFRDYQGQRVIVLPGKSESFIRAIPKTDFKSIRVIQKPKFDYEVTK